MHLRWEEKLNKVYNIYKKKEKAVLFLKFINSLEPTYLIGEFLIGKQGSINGGTLGKRNKMCAHNSLPLSTCTRAVHWWWRCPHK